MKLVRDRIPEIMRQAGARPAIIQIPQHGVLALLNAKLLEEAREVYDARDGQVIEELADVYEVIREMAARLGITLDDVRLAAEQKRAAKGGFSEGFVLVAET